MKIIKALLSLSAVTLCLSDAQSGGGISKPLKRVVVPVVAGVVTGGTAALVAGGVTAQAFAAGATTTIMAGVNQNRKEHGKPTVSMSFSVGMNGNGKVTSTNLGVGNGADGKPVVNIKSEAPETNFGVAPTIKKTQVDEEFKKLQHEARTRASKSFFTVGSNVSWEFTEETVGGKVYNRAKGADKDILVVPNSYGVNLVDPRPFSEMLAKGVSKFNLKTDDEEVASGSFLIEATSLLWHFESKMINGEKFHRAYVPAIPKFDVITKAGNKWWIPAGQYKVTDVKPAVRSSDRSANERHASPPRVDTKLEKARKIASEISKDAVEYAKSCIPEEVKGAGKFVFEYAKENSPQVIRQSFEFAADKLASVMSCLADFVEASETDVRRYLRDDLGLPQWVAQDIGSTVGIGGKCAIAFMPGKVLSETTKTIKLINVSFANGAGSGFKVALEQPLAKYKPVKFEKTKGASSKGGTGFEKEPKEPKLREVKIEKPAKIDWHKLSKDQKMQYQKSFLDNKLKPKGGWEKTKHKIRSEIAYYCREEDLWYTVVKGEKCDCEIWKVTGKKAKHQGAIECTEGRKYEGPKHPDAVFE